MSWVMRKVAHCDQCETEWWPKTGEYPKQCPNRECRSRNWNSTGGIGGVGPVERSTTPEKNVSVDVGNGLKGEPSPMTTVAGVTDAVSIVGASVPKAIEGARCFCGSEVMLWSDPNYNMPSRYKCFSKGHFMSIPKEVRK